MDLVFGTIALCTSRDKVSGKMEKELLGFQNQPLLHRMRQMRILLLKLIHYFHLKLKMSKRQIEREVVNGERILPLKVKQNKISML